MFREVWGCAAAVRRLGVIVGIMGGLALGVAVQSSPARDFALPRAEQWDVFELALEGPAEGNPFLEVTLSARFEQGGAAVTAEGFYDGEGVYRVRFSPPQQGVWSYRTQSNRPELNGRTGNLTVVPPRAGNRGPVQVHRTWHFAYADGTPYFQIGTTCYAWTHQPESLQEQTLKTLAGAPFNKLRMCVFPKAYTYNRNDPDFYPFVRKADGKFDFTRFDPRSWRHLEGRIVDLQRLGIEADLILFHPYDRWGFAEMGREADDRYVRYAVARLAAYRNVWWSLANEYDLMAPGAMQGHRGDKSMEDWDRIFQLIQRHDPYGRLRSIHNCRGWYDHSKPWVTHCSIQSSNFGIARETRDKYRKPVVYDECRYEGNIPQGWGNISGRQMVRHFWLGTIAGCYVGHGETYTHPEDILWWSKGGVLHGESPPRIAFLREVVSVLPFDEMTPSGLAAGIDLLAKPGEAYLVYADRDGEFEIPLAGEHSYVVDQIDTWEMHVAALPDAPPGRYRGRLAAGEALRLIAYRPGQAPRRRIEAAAAPTSGQPPLTVRFSTAEEGDLQWTFGDGTTAAERSPVHVYAEPGVYAASLAVREGDRVLRSAPLRIAVDHRADRPRLRVGFTEGETHPLKFTGPVRRGDGGALILGDAEPWKCVQVGDAPLADLEGLRSLTILGWARAVSRNTGAGGNRILCNLNYDRAGVDLVCLADGRMRLAVNEWPDRSTNDSSPGKLRLGEWTFFAVTYDAQGGEGNARWYFGDRQTPAALDRTQTYQRGPTGAGSGPLAVGNYNATLHRHGLDRQFRGELRGLQVFGSRIGGEGALPVETIRQLQRASAE